MIVGSLLLILVAVVLLVLGLADGSSPLLISSIGASLVAAVVLMVGVRQAAADGVDEEYLDDRSADGQFDGDEDDLAVEEPLLVGARGARRPAASEGASGAFAEPVTQVVPGGGWEEPEPPIPVTAPVGGLGNQPGRAEAPGFAAEPVGYPAEAGVVGPDADLDPEEDPPDEPAPQILAAVEAAQVARLAAEVLVIDGRPRYHLPGCVHLLGRESEPLPVSEAVELGFSPCSLCEPATTLLTGEPA